MGRVEIVVVLHVSQPGPKLAHQIDFLKTKSHAQKKGIIVFVN
jgi:hypothetical protein